MMNEDEVIDAGTDEVLGKDAASSEEVATDLPTEKPVSMDETLRAKFRELTADPKVADEVIEPAVNAGEKIAPKEKVVAPIVDEQGRVRGPDGKFAAAAPETQKTAAVAPVEKVVAPGTQADPSIAKAPTSWKGPAQAKWDAVDPEIKAEVHRRESDFHNGIKQYKADADTFKLLDAEIRPYEAMIRAAGVPPQALIRDFFNTAYQFKTGTPEGKVETLLNIAKAWNVDLGLLPGVQERMEAGQPVVTPEYRQLEQRFNQLHESVTQRELREKQERDAAATAERDHIGKETAAWAVGKEYYEVAKLRMAALLESGQAKDLDDAYTQAIWAVPEVRATLIAQQQEADRKLAVEKAAAAKQASSTNVKPRGTPPAKQTAKVGTMEDTIREQFRKLTAAN